MRNSNVGGPPALTHTHVTSFVVALNVSNVKWTIICAKPIGALGQTSWVIVLGLHTDGAESAESERS